MRSLLLADPENFGRGRPHAPYVKQTPDRAVLALFEPRTDEAACTCWLYPDLAQPAEAQLAKEPSAVCVAVAEDAVGADCLIRRSRKAAPIWTVWSALISARPPLPYSTPCARPSPAARSRMRAPCCAACAL
ncbi:MAG: hypothetical protein ACLSTO_00545 [Bilophila wadsworthia]